MKNNGTISIAAIAVINAQGLRRRFSRVFTGCLALVFFLAAHSYSYASGITLVQSTSTQGSGVSAVSAKFPNNNVAGNLIIVFVRMSSTTQTVSLTDTTGNQYHPAVSQAQSSDGHQIYIFYASNIKAGANTITATFSSSNNHAWLAIYEYSGLSTTNPLDRTAAAQGSSSIASSGTTPVTTSANELVVAGVGLPASSQDQVTAGSGFTILQQNTFPSGTSPAANEAMTVAATGTFAGTFALSGVDDWSAVVATFVQAAGPAPLAVSTSTLPNGTVNVAYNATLTATGGTGTYTSWAITSGALPPGLSLAPATGLISGTPASVGTANFTVEVTDSSSTTASKPLSITINPAPPPLSISTVSLPNGTVNVPYNAMLAATGGTGTYTSWAITSGALPPGLSLASATGVISGTPTSAGTANFTAQVTDSSSTTASKPLSITVNPAAGGAVTLVQSGSVEGSGVSSISKAFATANTAGDLIIAFVRMSSTTQTVSLTDTAGNQYNPAVSQAQSSDGHQIYIFYASNIKAGANTVTATFSSSNNHPWLAIYEYSGLSTTNPLDQTAGAQGTSSSASSGTTPATTSANELIFAGLGLPSGSSVTVTAASGFAMALQDTNQNGSRAASENGTASTPGAYAGAFTLSGNAEWSCVAATFKPASGAATLVSITVTPANPSIAPGQTQQFTATGTYSDGSKQTLPTPAWGSSDTAVATISATGLASSTGIGVTTISASSGTIAGSTVLYVSSGYCVTAGACNRRTPCCPGSYCFVFGAGDGICQ